MANNEQTTKPITAAQEFLTSKSDKLAEWCVEGSGLSALDLVRVGTMVVAREPKFQDPRVWPSLYLALITCAQLGLEPSGPLGEAYIIPYWDKKMGINLAQLQPGYRGLIKLMTQGGIKSVRSYVVHANDHFKMSLGSRKEVIHEPCWKEEPGDAVAVYSIATYHDGDEDYELAPWSDVDKAKNSAKGKSPAWETWPEQMARKFIIKRHANQLPLSPVARKAIAVDNIDSDEGAIETQRVLDVEVIKELPAPKEESKLASKLKGRKESRKTYAAPETKKDSETKETPEQANEEKKEVLKEMCSFCGSTATDIAGEPCETCRKEILESEAESAGQ